jgi:hypothetical protein
MKLKNLIYSAVTATILVMGLSNCKKSAFDINQNPNNATDSTVSYDVILPAALHSTGVLVGTQWGFLQNWMGFWARSGTYAPNVTEETYNITTTFGNGIWNTAYDNNYDYQIMQIKAKADGASMYEAIARIMKSHNFQILVDVYGNVPYTQALKGNANPTPKYDKGNDIYHDLLKQLDTAITLIQGATLASNRNIQDYDIMFGNNLYPATTFADQKARWGKFANTLKLRLLVHLMNGGVNTPQGVITGFDIPGEIAKINANGYGFLGAGENAQVNPGYKSDKPNPFYNSYKASTTGAQTANNVYYRANAWGIDYYGYNGDPRRTRVYEAGANGLVGVEYGLPPVTDNAAANLAGIGPGLYKTNSAPQAILTAAESFFLQAEATHRGFLSGSSAATLTNTGISESFAYLGATGAAAYMSGNAGYADVDYNAVSLNPSNPNIASGGLFTIISQKWFALNGTNTLEVWNDYRRVDMKNNAGVNVGHFIYGTAVGYDPGPPISVSPQNVSTQIPVRLLYPQTEYNYNAANVGSEGAIDKFTSRVFWDIL